MNNAEASIQHGAREVGRLMEEPRERERAPIALVSVSIHNAVGPEGVGKV